MKSKGWIGLCAVVLLSAVGLCCQRRNAAVEPTIIVIETEKQPPPAPPPVRSTPDPQTPSWLFASRFQEGAKGPWVRGEFDAKKNKLVIRTNDVSEFAVNTADVLIDWDKLVVLSINGKNSELRKRDFTVYRFELDSHGQWVVKE